MSRIRVGTSGYTYAHWKGVLYPKGLPTPEWLRWYARFFDVVELNAPFYRLPTADAVRRWYSETPKDFIFAVKGSRFLTHMKRLTELSDGLHRFFEPILLLGDKLGPVLWQLPPQMAKPDPDRLDCFLSHLPLGVRSVLEFRSPNWCIPEVLAVLKAHRVPYCEHDFQGGASPGVTGAFRYVRFHGANTRYGGRYEDATLERSARDLAAWTEQGRGREAYVFFNNDLGGHAVRDATRFRAYLGGREMPAPEIATPASH